ncbi:hypothetical protein KFK09_022245 [Dendrobium nobile]|uniref:FLZ-type domain-containing protein n=1 Tax=Dendrobium nobile TaxID=94219 RepID=A0A8T3AIG1_DENNO|nr:hypothetical protein KFK09_022245 [Dendrobium nobile]
MTRHWLAAAALSRRGRPPLCRRSHGHANSSSFSDSSDDDLSCKNGSQDNRPACRDTASLEVDVATECVPSCRIGKSFSGRVDSNPKWVSISFFSLSTSHSCFLIVCHLTLPSLLLPLSLLEMLSRTRSIFQIEEGEGDYDFSNGDFAVDTDGLVGLQILIKHGGIYSKLLIKSSMKKNKPVLKHLSAEFLKSCFSCSNELSLQKEVYMYRYGLAT